MFQRLPLLHKKTLAKIPRDAFDLVFIDEAHHGAAESYKEILDHFTGASFMVGVTATHLRGDGISITSAEYFSSVVVYHTIGQLGRSTVVFGVNIDLVESIKLSGSETSGAGEENLTGLGGGECGDWHRWQFQLR